MAASSERLYRFAPRDRAGWFLGLGAAQCLTGGGCLLVGAAAVSATGSPFPALPAVGLGLAFVFGRWRGRPLYEWAPILTRWSGLRLRRRTRWSARVPLLGPA